MEIIYLNSSITASDGGHDAGSHDAGSSRARAGSKCVESVNPCPVEEQFSPVKRGLWASLPGCTSEKEIPVHV